VVFSYDLKKLLKALVERVEKRLLRMLRDMEYLCRANSGGGERARHKRRGGEDCAECQKPNGYFLHETASSHTL